MPIPQPRKNEKENKYMGRCMEFMKDEKYPQKQKVAICLNTLRGPQKKAKGEVEIDFSEDIKNMKKEEVKIEEAPKVEATIEPTNTAVTAPAPEVKVEEVKTEVKAEIDGKGETIQTMMLQMQNQYKIFHWQTMSYSQHESFGEVYDSLSNKIDEFIETYMGKYGRVISIGTFNLSLANYATTDFVGVTDSYINFLISLSSQLDSAKDSDLLNIRDEILGSLNKLKYLLTLV